jgi:hypothetical protein
MKTIIPIDVITLGDDNSYHLFVGGRINGQSYDLLIDTGASHTIFDLNLLPAITEESGERSEIQSSGIQAGDLQSRMGYVEKFELGDLKREQWTVILIDLTHINNLYRKFSAKVVAGLIGSDLLLQYNAIVDYKKKELTLRNIKRKEH